MEDYRPSHRHQNDLCPSLTLESAYRRSHGRIVAIDRVITLLGGLFCTRMNLERVGVNMLPRWEQRSMW
jgi:hypothetical protein